MRLDLSTLTIPSADVVPEPTAKDWELFDSLDCSAAINRLVYGLARRCLELEVQLYLADKASDFNEDTAKRRIAKLEDEVNDLKMRTTGRVTKSYADLEAEVARLQNELDKHRRPYG